MFLKNVLKSIKNHINYELSEREIKKIINKNVSESIKSLGINLTKEVKDLYL